jgi:hypothetical protein
LYNAFKGNKKYFIGINPDKRCKIVSINKFDSDKNWSVERWGSKEEKIELAIEETDKIVSISGFSDIISDLVMTCNELIISLQDSVKIDDKIGHYKSMKIEDIFNIKKGIAKYTKTYIKEREGSYPVYSANTKQDGVLGYINHFNHDVESIQIYYQWICWNSFL